MPNQDSRDNVWMEEMPKVKMAETAMKMAVHAPWPDMPFSATEIDETPSPPAINSPAAISDTLSVKVVLQMTTPTEKTDRPKRPKRMNPMSSRPSTRVSRISCVIHTKLRLPLLEVSNDQVRPCCQIGKGTMRPLLAQVVIAAIAKKQSNPNGQIQSPKPPYACSPGIRPRTCKVKGNDRTPTPIWVLIRRAEAPQKPS